MPRAREREEDQAHAAQAPAAAPPAPAPDAASLLALQRTAGNAAVARAFGGRSGGPSLARLLTGNPQDLAPVPGGATGTVHDTPTLADAVNHQAPTAAGGRSVSGMSVRAKVTSAAPIEAESVTEDDLFEREATPMTSSAPASSAFTPITEIRGSVAAPMIEEAADDSLFIDPGPKAQDVQQGGIGDCWDMATFIGIVNRDPNKIRSMMSPDGTGGASVTFFRRVTTPAPAPPAPAAGPPPPPPPPIVTFQPETVTVDNTLAFRRAAAPPAGAPPLADQRQARSRLPDGTVYGHRIHGAQLRAAPAPKQRFWWAELNGGVLEIHRRDVYQMARWVPLLEKAHARFSESYGQYGHSGQVPSENEKTSQASGYQRIDGGFPGYTLTMFYGAEGQYTAGGTGDAVVTRWRPNMATAALLSANRLAFDRLLTLAGRQESFRAGEATAPIVTARALGGAFGTQQYADRLQLAITAARNNREWRGALTSQTRADIRAVDRAITAWQNAAPDPSPVPAGGLPANAKTPRQQAMVAAARTATDPSRNPELVHEDRNAVIKAMLDLLLVVKNMPVDWSQGSRSVYSGHEYSVLSVNIKGTDGEVLPIQDTPPAQRPALYPRVDVDDASAIRLMNPHHMNEPDPSGRAPDTGGEFNVSIRRFFRLFGAVMSAEMNTTPAP